MAQRTRKRYWIDRQIQGALATRIIVHWMIFAGVGFVLTLSLQYLSDPFTPVGQQLHTLWQNQGLFVLVMAILLPVFVYDAIKLSNRFAGPVLRLRRVMNEIADGKPAERLAFRDNDFWLGMAKDFNSLVDKGYFDREPEPSSSERELEEVS